MTLEDIAGFLNTRTDELGLQEKWDEYVEGVKHRATPQGFGEALADNLSADPRTGDFGVVGAGAIHGINSKIFPASWKGTKGKAWQMRDAGATPEEIRKKSLEETGYEIYFQNLYKDGKFNRADLKMNVPPINAKAGRRKKVANLDQRQDYPLKDFYNDPDIERGYPGLQESVRVSTAPDDIMGGSPVQAKAGKYGEKGQNKIRFNEEYDDFMNRPDEAMPEELQHLIDEVERFPPGGNPVSDPNYANLSGEVDGRAMNSEWDTILDLRKKGLSPLEIRQTIQERPLSDRFDTPDIFRETKPRGLKREWESANRDSILGTHQLQEEQARIGTRREGLANPSIGISAVDNPGDRGYFGKVNLIPDKELITPGKDIQVFSDDAYTITYPNKLAREEFNLTDLDSISNYMTATDKSEIKRTSKNLQKSFDEDFTLQSHVNDLTLLTPKRLHTLDQVMNYGRNIKPNQSTLLSNNRINDELVWLEEAGINPKDALKAVTEFRFRERANNLGALETIEARNALGPFKKLNALIDEAPNTHGYLEAKPTRITGMDEYPAVVAPTRYDPMLQKMNKKFGTKVILDNLIDAGKFSDETFEELDKLGLLYD